MQNYRNQQRQFKANCHQLRAVLLAMEEITREILTLMSESQEQLFCDYEVVSRCILHRLKNEELTLEQMDSVEKFLESILE